MLSGQMCPSRPVEYNKYVLKLTFLTLYSIFKLIAKHSGIAFPDSTLPLNLD